MCAKDSAEASRGQSALFTRTEAPSWHLPSHGSYQKEIESYGGRMGRIAAPARSGAWEIKGDKDAIRRTNNGSQDSSGLAGQGLVCMSEV